MRPKFDRRTALPLRWPSSAPGRFDLERALSDGKIEFWYQPKIDLRKKRLVGVEAFARLCDRKGNVMQGAELVAGASERGLAALTERALVSALKTSAGLIEIGIEVRLAVNVNVAALTELPLSEIVQRYQPQRRPVNVVFDVAEAEVLANLDKLQQVSVGLGKAGLSVAVDDFGAALLSVVREKEALAKVERTFHALEQLRNISFAEMKIDRTLVKDVSGSVDRQHVCEYIIKMTHALGSSAVAVGIENTKDLATLKRLGCDIGQGYLFGRPMTEDELLVLLWERAARAKDKVHAA
jgi:EAL domain-containing protein (putative c-di-GMP-specific phosphodiesterase class I)